MIEINHLVKKYGDHVAVDDLTMKIEPGRIYGFLGPNGAGKSTTMNIITGYIGATSGDVSINGHDILKEPEEAKKAIGYLPEIPPLYNEMTVYEYLRFVAELKKIEKKEIANTVDEVMSLTKITDMKDRLIKNLSKGYKQRVGLAQAIMGYPEIIILDEPTVGLDPKQIIEIRDLIRQLGKKHTIILSSHILTEVKEVCDYIFIISKGKLVANDEKEELFARMNAENLLHLKLRANQDKVKEFFDGYEDAIDVKINEDGQECEVLVETSKDVDVREELFYALADKKMPIVEMYYKGKSLEDIFLELTAAEKAPKYAFMRDGEGDDVPDTKDNDNLDEETYQNDDDTTDGGEN